MASFLNKAREKIETALGQNQSKDNDQVSDNYGTHSTSTANKIDPRVDSDRDYRNDPTDRVGGFGNTQTTDQYGTTRHAEGLSTSGAYGSSGNSGYDNTRSENVGPHSSNLLNKADPRVDSDRDHRNDPASRVGGIGSTQRTQGDYGRTSIHDAVTSETHGGHHGHTGHTGHGTHTGGLGGVTSTGFSGVGSGNTYDNSRSNEGPHSSNLLNKLDPRQDSDRDYRNDPTSRVGGYGNQGDGYERTGGIQGDGYERTGGIQGGPMSGSRGQYDVGRSTEGYGGGAHLSGDENPSRTAGPHNSDMLNKLDPRVDSDRDGSKTYGGNQTYR